MAPEFDRTLEIMSSDGINYCYWVNCLSFLFFLGKDVGLCFGEIYSLVNSHVASHRRHGVCIVFGYFVNFFVYYLLRLHCYLLSCERN